MRGVSVALAAVLISVAQARLGMGPCPTTYPKVDNPFGASSVLTNGRYHPILADELGIWAFDFFIKSKTERIECFAANVTKTSSGGFTWDPYTQLETLKWCRREVKCDPAFSTCNCYVTAKPWEVVWVDQESQSAIMYSCMNLRYAAETAYKNLGYPAYVKNLMTTFDKYLDSMHYSALGVAT